MKNALIAIVVLVLVVLGIFLFMGRGNTLEAPVYPPAGQTMNTNPVPDAPGSVTVVTTTTVNNPPVKEFTVTGKNYSFSPSLITVKKGDRVRITFQNTQGFHDFRIDAYGAATKQTNSPSTEVIEFVADKTGSFEYYCSVGTHRAMGMKGTLKVE